MSSSSSVGKEGMEGEGIEIEALREAFTSVSSFRSSSCSFRAIGGGSCVTGDEGFCWARELSGCERGSESWRFGGDGVAAAVGMMRLRGRSSEESEGGFRNEETSLRTMRFSK